MRVLIAIIGMSFIGLIQTAFAQGEISDGFGIYETQIQVPLGIDTTSISNDYKVIIGEFSGDAIDDIVILEEDTATYLYTGNVSGGYEGPIALAYNADLYSASQTKSFKTSSTQVYMLYSNATGAFIIDVTANLGDLPNNNNDMFDGASQIEHARPNTRLYVEDLNNDNKLDIIAVYGAGFTTHVNQSSDTSLYAFETGQFNRLFSTSTSTSGNESQLQDVYFGDFDGDNYLDIYAMDLMDSKLLVYVNDADTDWGFLPNIGTATYETLDDAVVSSNIPSGGFVYDLEDFDGDDYPDVLITSYRNSVTSTTQPTILVYRSSSLSIPDTNNSGQYLYSYTDLPIIAGGNQILESGAPSVRIIDFDNDADLDVVFYGLDSQDDSRTAFGVFTNNGSGTFSNDYFSNQILTTGRYSNDISQEGQYVLNFIIDGTNEIKTLLFGSVFNTLKRGYLIDDDVYYSTSKELNLEIVTNTNNDTYTYEFLDGQLSNLGYEIETNDKLVRPTFPDFDLLDLESNILEFFLVATNSSNDEVYVKHTFNIKTSLPGIDLTATGTEKDFGIISTGVGFSRSVRMDNNFKYFSLDIDNIGYPEIVATVGDAEPTTYVFDADGNGIYNSELPSTTFENSTTALSSYYTSTTLKIGSNIFLVYPWVESGETYSENASIYLANIGDNYRAGQGFTSSSIMISDTAADRNPIKGPGVIKTGDINADGLTDIVVTTNFNTGNIYVYLNTTTDVTSPTFDQHVLEDYTPVQGLELVDLNDDGYLDLLISTQNHVEVHEYDDSESNKFTDRVTKFDFDNGSWSKKKIPVDLNADGHLDYVTVQEDDPSSGSSPLSIVAYINDGTPYTTAGLSAYTKHTYASDIELVSMHDFFVYDLDHDGDLDFVASVRTSDFDYGISASKHSGDNSNDATLLGDFEPLVDFPKSTSGAQNYQLLDIDNDGLVELTFTQWSDNQNTNSLSFLAPVSIKNIEVEENNNSVSINPVTINTTSSYDTKTISVDTLGDNRLINGYDSNNFISFPGLDYENPKGLGRDSSEDDLGLASGNKYEFYQAIVTPPAKTYIQYNVTVTDIEDSPSVGGGGNFNNAPRFDRATMGFDSDGFDAEADSVIIAENKMMQIIKDSAAVIDGKTVVYGINEDYSGPTPQNTLHRIIIDGADSEVAFETSTSFSGFSTTAIDLNNDGLIDLSSIKNVYDEVTFEPTKYLVAGIQQPDGTIVETDYEFESGVSQYIYRDIDDDGDIDFVFAVPDYSSQNMTFSVLENTNGVFQGSDETTLLNVDYNNDGFSTIVDIFDYANDGTIDIIYATRSGLYSIEYGSSVGDETSLDVTFDNADYVDIELINGLDFNGDGKDEYSIRTGPAIKYYGLSSSNEFIELDFGFDSNVTVTYITKSSVSEPTLFFMGQETEGYYSSGTYTLVDGEWSLILPAGKPDGLIGDFNKNGKIDAVGTIVPSFFDPSAGTLPSFNFGIYDFEYAVPVAVASGTKFVAELIATDDDDDALTYTVYGPDANLFEIINDNEIAFKQPAVLGDSFDADENGVYKIGVTVSDGERDDRVSLSIAVQTAADIAADVAFEQEDVIISTGGSTGDTTGGSTGDSSGGSTGDSSGGSTGDTTGGSTGDALASSDLDNDGIVDRLDDDIDGDGVPNVLDISPRDATLSADTDSDGIDDTVDDDIDGDGIANELDEDANGDGILDSVQSLTNVGSTSTTEIFNTELQVQTFNVLADITNGSADIPVTLQNVETVVGEVAIVDGQIEFTPPANFVGTVEIKYLVDNGSGKLTTSTLFVDVDTSVQDAPLITAPATISINATSSRTPIYLGNVSSVDLNGNNAPVTTLNDVDSLPPGRHTIYRQSTDVNGNTSIISQTLDIHPLVSFGQDIVINEGRSGEINVFLNGTAPEYPVEIPYVISGVTGADDHDLVSGTLTIESGTKGIIYFDVPADTVSESDESIQVSFGSGVNSLHNETMNVVITESEIVPVFNSIIQQNGEARQVVEASDDNVIIKTEIKNIAPGEEITVVITDADGLVIDDLDSVDGQITFSPEILNDGLNNLTVTITDENGNSVSQPLQVNRTASLPELSSTDDTDNDGVVDSVEGFVDTDGDRIPDYLDNESATHLLPQLQTVDGEYFIEVDMGLLLRLGKVAFAGNNGQARLFDGDLPDDQGFANVGGVFEFEVLNLPVAGQVVKIAIALINPIPEEPVYRKYNSTLDAWRDFVVDTNNGIYSAVGVLNNDGNATPGICPAPSSNAWVEGMIPGNLCIMLAVEDGGDNDTDGVANGAIQDPGGVSIVSDDIVILDIPTLTSNVVFNDGDTDNDLSLNLLTGIDSPDGSTLSLTNAFSSDGAVTFASDGELTFTPDVGFAGNARVNYVVNESNSGTNTLGFLDVYVSNSEIPEVEVDTVISDGQNPITIDVLANDSDPEGGSLTLVSATTLSGSVSIVDNKLVYMPDSTSSGTIDIAYVVRDISGSDANGVAEVTIVPIETVLVTNSQDTSHGSSINLFLIILLLTAILFRRSLVAKALIMAILLSSFHAKADVGNLYIDAMQTNNKLDMTQNSLIDNVETSAISVDEKSKGYSLGIKYLFDNNFFISGGYRNFGDFNADWFVDTTDSVGVQSALQYTMPSVGNGIYYGFGGRYDINASVFAQASLQIQTWEQRYTTSLNGNNDLTTNRRGSAKVMSFALGTPISKNLNLLGQIQNVNFDGDNVRSINFGFEWKFSL